VPRLRDRSSRAGKAPVDSQTEQASDRPVVGGNAFLTIGAKRWSARVFGGEAAGLGGGEKPLVKGDEGLEGVAE
jgi:hypothetical protein